MQSEFYGHGIVRDVAASPLGQHLVVQHLPLQVRFSRNALLHKTLTSNSSKSTRGAGSAGIFWRLSRPGALGFFAALSKLGVTSKIKTHHCRNSTQPWQVKSIPRGAEETKNGSSSSDLNTEYWRKGYDEGERTRPGFRSKAGDAPGDAIPEHVRIPFPTPLAESNRERVRSPSVRWSPESLGPRFRTLPAPADAPFLRPHGANQPALGSEVASTLEDRRTTEDWYGRKPRLPDDEIDSMCRHDVPSDHFRAVRPAQKNRATQVLMGHVPYRRKLEQSSRLSVIDALEFEELRPERSRKKFIERRTRIKQRDKPPPPDGPPPGQEESQIPQEASGAQESEEPEPEKEPAAPRQRQSAGGAPSSFGTRPSRTRRRQPAGFAPSSLGTKADQAPRRRQPAGRAPASLSRHKADPVEHDDEDDEDE
mmetsp:Transcript_14501/g.34248  ORF Transcript_14501/g.34248 Transcript_14501/m.34248 type:complete len:423 (+) Transcript_14501:96-1364(+)